MQKSDAPTRISTATPGLRAAQLRLLDLEPSRPVRIVRLPAAFAHGLEQEGLTEGLEIDVERRVALGGPVIVRAGRARIAVARSVAAGVLVEDAPGDETAAVTDPR